MEYKKRKVKKSKLPKAPKQKPAPSAPKKEPIEKIQMAPKPSKLNKDVKRAPARMEYELPKRRNTMQAVDGGITKEQKERSKTFVISVFALILIAAITAVHFITPTGLFDYMQNGFSTWGNGKGFPLEVAGNKEKGLYVNGDVIYALTDTSVYAYNSSGKEITSYQHGYMSPTAVSSDQRMLVYDRGNYGIRVDSLYMNHLKTNLDHKIFAADLCDRGRLAVVTEKEKYASELVIYAKNYSDVLMRYSSAQNQISCVKLSSSGQKVAFSTIGMENGAYYSVIRVCDVSSGKTLAEQRIDNAMIVKLAASSGKIFAQGSDTLFTMNWDGDNFKEYEYSHLTYFIENDNGCITLAYHPSGDARQTTIVTFDERAKQLFSVTTDKTVSGVCSTKNSASVLSDSSVFVYNKKQDIIHSFETGYQNHMIAAYKSGVVSFADMKIDYNK